MLSATAPIPLSNQSLNAVNEFLRFEYKFTEITQVDGIKMVVDPIELKTNLTAAQVDYFLKIDRDMVQVDDDFIGSPQGSNTFAGIDGVLANLALPANVASDLEAKLIPAVQSAREATTTLITQLENLTPAQGGQSAAAVDYFQKIKGIEREAADDMLAFAKIEYQLIAADPNDLGPALGLQGTAAAGPAGALLNDLGVLTADTAPPSDLNGDGQVDAFIKTANQFLTGQNAFLNFEVIELKTNDATGHYLKTPPGRMDAGELDYFLKIDGDLAQNDADLARVAKLLLKDAQASTAGSTNTLDLSQETISSLQALVKAAQNAGAEAAALEKEVLGSPSGTTFQPGGGDAVFDKHKGEIEILSWSFGVSFAEMENSLINLDPNLGPALALSTGTTAPGPAGGLLNDMLVLAADANGAFTQNVAVVAAFLSIEGNIIQAENNFVAAEQAFINLGVQLPPAIVSYFTAVDNGMLEIDSGLLGTPGSTGTAATPGLDSILEGLSGLPASYVASPQALAKQAQSAQQAVTSALAEVQSTSSLPTPTPADQVYMKYEFHHLQADTKQAFATISANFDQIEGLLIGLDPSNQYDIQDSKNIADGAAKGQAQE
ncbi:MAG TPA: hypothetical protein VFI31_19305 [Pirellulales bacterium]|nr:hypothetical protein [Pirellulales bacterium]